MPERTRTGAGLVAVAVVVWVIVASMIVVGVQAAGPALAQSLTIAGRSVGIDRPVTAVDRRVVAYDGQVARTEGDQVTVTLDAEVLFDFDQATLTEQARTTLTELAATLNQTLAGPGVTVVGHTDGIGTADHNLDLSARRAEAVRDYLDPRVAVPASFAVEGRGSTEPVASDTRPDGSDDPEGRRRNRRVEVVFTARP